MPTTSAGEKTGRPPRGTLFPETAHSRNAAVAAGSIGPGCSQEAGEGQARRQDGEELAARHGNQPTASAGDNAGGRQNGVQSGEAEQSRVAAVAAGSIGFGFSQEVGEEPTQVRIRPLLYSIDALIT